MRFDGKKPIEFTDETVELEAEALEETKYKLKLPNSSPEPSGDDLDFGGDEEELDLGGEDLDMGDEEELDLGGEEGGSDDKPFDDEPFDAGVEADEDTDPEKFIQQLSGKLGQSMRDYTEDKGEPDFDLEKFAINSVVSASHTAEMDEEDREDIIDKVKTAGRGDDDSGEDVEDSGELDMGDEGDSGEELDLGGEEGDDSGELDLGGEEIEEGFDDAERGIEIRSRHFEKITSIIDQATTIEELDKAVEYVNQNANLNVKERIALANFHDIKKRELGGDMSGEEAASELGGSAPMNRLREENPCWKGYEQVGMKEKDGKQVPNCVPVKENLQEAEYQGKTVKLNKPSRGDVKKFKVYVKNDKGNVVKVNFGDKNMEIKRDDPERRKSFRAMRT
jgi:hypothetical protein